MVQSCQRDSGRRTVQGVASSRLSDAGDVSVTRCKRRQT